MKLKVLKSTEVLAGFYNYSSIFHRYELALIIPHLMFLRNLHTSEISRADYILNMLKHILDSKQRKRFCENFLWKKVSCGKDNMPEEKNIGMTTLKKLSQTQKNGL